MNVQTPAAHLFPGLSSGPVFAEAAVEMLDLTTVRVRLRYSTPLARLNGSVLSTVAFDVDVNAFDAVEVSQTTALPDALFPPSVNGVAGKKAGGKAAKGRKKKPAPKKIAKGK